MFAVIYRSFVFPEKENLYQKSWQTIAAYFKAHCGALGSALHKAESGEYIAYSHWPNKQMRDQFWGHDTSNLPPEIQIVVQTLKSCLDPAKPREEISMILLENLF